MGFCGVGWKQKTEEVNDDSVLIAARSPVPRASQNHKASSPLYKFISELSGLKARLRALGGGARRYRTSLIFVASWLEKVANPRRDYRVVPIYYCSPQSTRTIS
ncbi:hypothetical protein SADUNF_Sadunf08G0044700 [Salix dunnii]|uniref:Uncharacterized protein n=1 Tax=Salix dunnii TaxID=1413687 RepID=A0A835MXA0_9ROSI|nr:hypothetical protein SADUNF_Sadunf08G0044700 [Salix dunnii]